MAWKAAWPASAPPAASPGDPCLQYPAPVRAGLDPGLPMSRRVPPHCDRVTVRLTATRPWPAVNAPRVSAARRRSPGRAFTTVVDGLEPAQVLLHKGRASGAHDRLHLDQAVTAARGAPVAGVAEPGMAVGGGVDGSQDEVPWLGRSLAYQLPLEDGHGGGSRWAWVMDPRWPSQASTRYPRPLPAAYRPRQAGGAGQCVGWPWVPATLTKRKQRPSAGWNASA